jgi:hypothetical protein
VGLLLLLNSAAYTSRRFARKQWHIIANHCTISSTGQRGVGGNPSRSPCWGALRWHIAFASIGRNIFLACCIDVLTSRTLSNMSCKPLNAFMATSTFLEDTGDTVDMIMQYWKVAIRCLHQQF